MSKGFLFIATADRFVREAEVAATSIKRHCDLPITLVAHRDVDSEVFDTVVIDESPLDSYGDKPRNLLKTPYTKTIYLDADVYMVSAVPELFDLLDEVDIATTIDPHEFELRILDDPEFKDIPESMPIYQTGVIAYRSDLAAEFIRNWEAIHTKEDTKRDQSSFRAALYNSSVNHRALPDIYNCLVNSPMQVTGEVKLFHDVFNSIPATKDDFRPLDRFSSRANKTTKWRLLASPRAGRIYFPTNSTLNTISELISAIIVRLTYIYRSIQWIPQSVREDGVRRTISKGIKNLIHRPD